MIAAVAASAGMVIWSFNHPLKAIHTSQVLDRLDNCRFLGSCMIFCCSLLSCEARDHAAVRQARRHWPCGGARDGPCRPGRRHAPWGGTAGRDGGGPSRGAPIMAIVSLSNQRVTIYDADGWILRAPVSSGQTGYETPAGVYSVIQKEEEHYSNLYDDASMPFMQRITWSGIALHAGPLPGYPASHGCVRMPYEFAQRLFDMTKIGMRVIVARNDVRPVKIDHPVLFKPKMVRGDLALNALTAHWDAAREEAQAAAPDAAPPEAGGPSLPAQPSP